MVGRIQGVYRVQSLGLRVTIGGMIGGNIAEVVGEYVGMLVGIISFLISKQSIEWRPPLNPKTPKIRNHPTKKRKPKTSSRFKPSNPERLNERAAFSGRLVWTTPPLAPPGKKTRTQDLLGTPK